MINRNDVLEFLQLHAQVAIAETRMKELREAILPELAAGAATPDDLPYRLVRRLRHDLLRDYKAPLLDALKEMFKLSEYPLSFEEKAAAQLKEIEAAFDTREIETLRVEINKEYAAGCAGGRAEVPIAR